MERKKWVSLIFVFVISPLVILYAMLFMDYNHGYFLFGFPKYPYVLACIISLYSNVFASFSDMFRLIADQQRKATERKLGLLLHDCIQIPRVLGELAAFGGSNVDPSVRACVEMAVQGKQFIEVI